MTGRIPRVIEIDSADPFQRGLQRAERLGDELRRGADLYFDLFETVGVPLNLVREGALASADAAEQWSEDLVTEMRGVADGSGIDFWRIAALNARTEVLSSALGAKPGECSTIVSAITTPLGVQTWDWHEELAPFWHLQRVSGTTHGYVGLTEHGILGKIGINNAGVGVMLNILGHRSDRAGGVPVHLVGARILADAANLAEAVDLLLAAPVSTSSAITVLAPEGAAIVELSPEGSRLIEPHDGVLLHTNHFIDPSLSAGEKKGLYDPDSQLRLAELQSRVTMRRVPSSTEEGAAALLIDYLVSEPGAEAQLCCVPDPGAVFGDRWATLATVRIDAARRSLSVSADSPRDVSDRETIVLTAH